MKKLVDFTAWYADRKRIEKECEERCACASEFKKLVEAQTEEDWVAIIQTNFNWVCGRNIDGIHKIVESARGFQEGFAAVRDFPSGLWGFLKSDGTMLTEFQFAYARDFQEGFATVEDSSSGLWGFLKSDGTMLTGFQFWAVFGFQEGFAGVQNVKGGAWGWINARGEYTLTKED